MNSFIRLYNRLKNTNSNKSFSVGIICQQKKELLTHHDKNKKLIAIG